MNYSTYDLLCTALDHSVADVKRILDSGINVNSCDEPARETVLVHRELDKHPVLLRD